MDASSESNREIVSTRVFDAPRELVFRMWTEPEHIKRWWGPRGFTNTIHTMDVRPGGEWNFVMHGPDGTDYNNRIIYREIDRPSRMTYSHVSGPLFEATVTFDEVGAKTEVTVRMVFETAELRTQVAEKFGAVEGLHQTLARLDEQLADRLVITRVFDAPRELVFRAWTEPERLAQWWGPTGFKVRVVKLDLRPGGIFHYCMVAAGGGEMWGRFTYGEIKPPERLVFINSFSDPEGNITRAPFADAWPLEMLNIVTFDEHDGKTTLTLTGSTVGATDEERETYKAGHKSMHQGFGGTFDQLDAYLAGEGKS
jgi:uncharacterized protein YndB with AHSA1/START domain